MSCNAAAFRIIVRRSRFPCRHTMRLLSATSCNAAVFHIVMQRGCFPCCHTMRPLSATLCNAVASRTQTWPLSVRKRGHFLHANAATFRMQMQPLSARKCGCSPQRRAMRPLSATPSRNAATLVICKTVTYNNEKLDGIVRLVILHSGFEEHLPNDEPDVVL